MHKKKGEEERGKKDKKRTIILYPYPHRQRWKGCVEKRKERLICFNSLSLNRRRKNEGGGNFHDKGGKKREKEERRLDPDFNS